jgi:carboxypeptidase PM20D1
LKKASLISTPALLSLAASAVALAARTLRFRSKQLDVAPIDAIELPETAILDRLGRAIRIQTVSYEDPSEIDYEAFREFHSFIASEYPAVSGALRKTVINDYSLLLEWTGSEPDLNPVVLTAHMDVVPVERDSWRSDPFGGQIENGNVWGRGTLDDKGSLMSILEAVEHLASQGYRPRRTIYLGFGHDEERGSVGGLEGANEIARFLRERGVHADMVMDEGAMLDQSASPVQGRRVALIGIAAKGYVSIRLSAAATGGHAMVPPVDHSMVIEQLARAIITLQEHPFPFRIDPAVGYLLDYIGPESRGLDKLVLANRWLFKRLLIAKLARKNTTAALLHTTGSPTLIRAGTTEQSLPATGHAIVNFRTLPGHTSEDLLRSVRAVLKDCPVHVELQGVPHDPLPTSSVGSPSYKILEKTIRETFPGITVAPFLVPGRGALEYYREVAEDSYMFAPLLYSPELLLTLHGHNERIPTQNYLSMVRFYVRLIENLNGHAPSADPRR